MSLVKFVSFLLVISVSTAFAERSLRNFVKSQEGIAQRRKMFETSARFADVTNDEDTRIVHHFINHATTPASSVVRIRTTTEAPDVINDHEIALIQNMLDKNQMPIASAQRSRLSQIGRSASLKNTLVQLPKGQLGFLPENSLNQRVQLGVPKPVNKDSEIIMQVKATTKASVPVSSRLGGQGRVSHRIREKLLEGNGYSPLENDNMILKVVSGRKMATTTPNSGRISVSKNFCTGVAYGEQIAHPDQPRSYIACLDTEIVMSCPSTLVYNTYLNRCDRTVDEPPLACSSSPCRNGGTCTDTDNYGFTCDCTAEFSGITCDRGSDPCDSNPCAPNGACSALSPSKLSTKYYCVCDGGSSYGLDCDANRFENPCLRQDAESYHPSAMDKSMFIHCENDVLNLRPCNEELVWSQKKLSCITPEALADEALEEQSESDLSHDESNFDDHDHAHHGYEFIEE